jgi:predicted KAP-like P-loop ATPase
VFIDDLDRCLPETVVDTFEAIRLSLNAPKTAYVVAANQQVVESAIDSRYPELRRQDGTGVGADYLEKML